MLPRDDDAKRTLTPKLRFPEFHNNGWEERRLGDVADIKTGPFGSTLHQSDYAQSGTPIVTVEHLGDFGLVHKNLPLVSDEDKKRLATYVLREGDIVFSRVGSVDRSSLVRKNEDGWLFSGRLLRVRTNQAALDPAFLSFYFQLETTRRRIRSVAVGQTMPSLNTEILNDVDVLTATPAEQQKIAECLTSLDELIAAQGRKVEGLAAHKKGLMQQLFPREGQTLPRLRFPEFRNKGEWEEKHIRDLAEDGLTNGIFNNTKLGETDFRLINVSDMYLPVPIIDSALAYARAPIEEIEKKTVRPGDIFFTRSSLVREGIAYSNIYLGGKSKATFDGHLIRLRPDASTNDPLFLHFALKMSAVRTQLVCKSKTATMTTIGQDDVAETELAIPAIAEQQRIADCLGVLDARLSAEADKLAALKAHKKGLMQQLFPSPEGD